MTEEVRLEHVEPRSLAAIRATSSPDRLSTAIIELLDQVWPVLRAQAVRTEHNVVIYRKGDNGDLVIDVGVEVLSPFAGDGDVQPSSTPEGTVATTAHLGDYAQLGRAYERLDHWCSENRRRPAGVNWEVYGDWSDEPAERRTDVFYLLDE